MSEWYRLEGKIPVPTSFEEIRASEDDPKKRIVKQEDVGKLWVSTVFLPINHYNSTDGPPLVFETMVFDHSEGARRWLELYCDRYSTWELALEGHRKAVKWAEQNQPIKG